MEFSLYNKNDKLYFKNEQDSEIKLDILLENNKIYDPFIIELILNQEYEIEDKEYIILLSGEIDKDKLLEKDKIKADKKSKIATIKIKEYEL